MDTMSRSPINQQDILAMIQQLSRSDLSYFTLIFLVLKAVAIIVLWKMFKENQDYDNLYKKHLAQIGQHQSDGNNVNI